MSCDTCGLLVNNAPEFLNEDTMNAIFSMYGINKVVAIGNVYFSFLFGVANSINTYSKLKICVVWRIIYFFL